MCQEKECKEILNNRESQPRVLRVVYGGDGGTRLGVVTQGPPTTVGGLTRGVRTGTGRRDRETQNCGIGLPGNFTFLMVRTVWGRCLEGSRCSCDSQSVMGRCGGRETTTSSRTNSETRTTRERDLERRRFRGRHEGLSAEWGPGPSVGTDGQILIGGGVCGVYMEGERESKIKRGIVNVVNYFKSKLN